MRINKKIVFATAYIVVALVGYALFVKYSLSKYEEERAILEAEYAAMGHDPRRFEYFFFYDSVHGRNVVWVGIALVFGGLVGAFVFSTISGALKERRARSMIIKPILPSFNLALNSIVTSLGDR